MEDRRSRIRRVGIERRTLERRSQHQGGVVALAQQANRRQHTRRHEHRRRLSGRRRETGFERNRERFLDLSTRWMELRHRFLVARGIQPGTPRSSPPTQTGA